MPIINIHWASSAPNSVARPLTRPAFAGDSEGR